jgi:hypothetical protein
LDFDIDDMHKEAGTMDKDNLQGVKELRRGRQFSSFQDWVVIWGVVPGTRSYWPSAAFFVGIWVSMAVVLLSLGIPDQNSWTILFGLGCLFGAIVNFLVFWFSDRLYRSDRERVERIKHSWGSSDPDERTDAWKPI